MWRCRSTSSSPTSTAPTRSSAKQVRLPGFRPGKAPAKLLEARVGRGAVLEQVVNDALPSRYSQAVTTSDVQPLGQPEIEITKIEDGEELAFTAEVDVRPEITLPDLSTPEGHRRPDRGQRRRRRRRAAVAARPVRHAHRRRACGRGGRLRVHRPVGHRRRRGRARGQDRGAVARGRLRSADRRPRRGARRHEAGETKTFTTTLVAGRTPAGKPT